MKLYTEFCLNKFKEFIFNDKFLTFFFVLISSYHEETNARGILSFYNHLMISDPEGTKLKEWFRRLVDRQARAVKINFSAGVGSSYHYHICYHTMFQIISIQYFDIISIFDTIQ